MSLTAQEVLVRLMGAFGPRLLVRVVLSPPEWSVFTLSFL